MRSDSPHGDSNHFDDHFEDTNFPHSEPVSSEMSTETRSNLSSARRVGFAEPPTLMDFVEEPSEPPAPTPARTPHIVEDGTLGKAVASRRAAGRHPRSRKSVPADATPDATPRRSTRTLRTPSRYVPEEE